MAKSDDNGFNAISWIDDHLRIIDQTFLPSREIYTNLNTTGQVWEAIKNMKVRGAPAIGIAAAYGLYMGARDIRESSFESFYLEVERLKEYLESSRPTAVNLQWALNRILTTIQAHKDKDIGEIKSIILDTAQTIHDEDERLCKSIGQYGVEIVPEEAKILTHCNTGALAASKYGTAFSVIWHAHNDDKVSRVWVDETRPLLQGARLTAWELKKEEIPFSLITDSTSGFLMQQGLVDLVIVGADRIAANGDTANKIGTYNLAVLANAHDIPFYVAAPYSTIDLSIEQGEEIPIEERDSAEVTKIGSKEIAPAKIEVYNPAFDITPNHLISGFITDKGIIHPEYSKSLAKFADRTVSIEK
jgi:methylthioribose-1-phosphate isomerase